MAEFSKQYCDVWDNGFPYDFDIEKIAKDLTKVIIILLYVKDLDSTLLLKIGMNRSYWDF